ncbi:MAG: type II toxin-antitoxin system RelE/ParE family toxin [Euryarchaeota archaeon]|nr:type II toxin-antitoxin system RelE/ParE family toxin [Euryarchaeota archaeon]
MYRVEFSKRAAKDLAGLERAEQSRVLKRLESAAKDPVRFFLPLKGIDGFRMRVGDLRVIAHVEPAEQIIIVATIGRRENIYK